MRVIRRILHQMPLYIIWVLSVFLFWSFVFVNITDTSYEKKIVIFADCYRVDQTKMAARLEEEMPRGIKMIKVRPFSYAMFDSDAIERADLYLIMEQDLELYGDFYTVPSWMDDLIEEARVTEEDILRNERGEAIGIRVYDKDTMQGISGDLITYMPDFEETKRELERAEREGIETITEETTLTEPANVYLFFGKNSVHLENESTEHGACYEAAITFLKGERR